MSHAVVTELEKFNGDKSKTATEHNAYRHGGSPFLRQAVVTSGTIMLNLGAGATAGFSAILIPQLKNSKNHIRSIEMISWVAAMSPFALVFGNLISGYVMEKCGRKTSQVLLSFPFMCGWAIIGLSNDINLILLGRFITGLCQGWLGPLGSVYVGEISSPAHRGLFLAALSLAIATGILMSHLYGTFLHYQTSSLLCGLFPLLGCLIMCYAPESPAWLGSKNRLDECIASFYWYRGHSEASKNELDNMIKDFAKRDKSRSKLETLKVSLGKPEFWKPLCIMCTFFVITQLSGVNVICAYTTDMMEELMGGKTDAYAAMLCIDVLRCASLAAACVLLKKLGRRPMAVFSGIFTSLSLITLAVYLYLVHEREIRHISPVISLGLMAINIVVSNFGIVPLPWNMVGELFATETKSIGSGISVMMTSVAFFATVKTAPAMFYSIGYHGTYMFYGVSTLLGTLFLMAFLPETKNKTLLQIEEHYRKRDKTVES